MDGNADYHLSVRPAFLPQSNNDFHGNSANICEILEVETG